MPRIFSETRENGFSEWSGVRSEANGSGIFSAEYIDMSSHDSFAFSELMTVNEVAEYLNVSRSKIHHLARNGNLPGFRVGHKWRFERRQVTERSEAIAKRPAAP